MKLSKIIFIFLILLGLNGYSQEYAKNPVKKAKVSGTANKEGIKEKAGTPITTVTNANDADFEALMQKAVGLSQEYNFEEAIKIYTQALALSNEENAYRALFGRGGSYFRKKEFDKALIDFNTILNARKQPHDNARGHVYNMRALTNNILGKSKEACADYKMARELGAVSGDPIPGFNCD